MTTEYSKYKIHSCLVAGEKLELHPLKAVYWPSQDCLIISDLHLGKAKHFVKAGIALPARALESKNIDRLQRLTEFYRPKKIILLGDLFHSSYNTAWEQFCKYTRDYPNVEFVLVEGNHDLLDRENYEAARLKLRLKYAVGPFIFTHEPIEGKHKLYNLSGHIHPGVRMQGAAKQTARFPCFFFGKIAGLLPAFGAFTGLMTLSPKKKDQVFIVAEEEVIAV